MTDREAREALAKVHSPRLDALRAKLATMETSVLLWIWSHTESLVDEIDEQKDWTPKDGPPKKTPDDVVFAATLAVADEVNRRFPVPT